MSPQHPESPDVPWWDPEARTLWFRGQRVHTFRNPAEWQTQILAAFQVIGWAHSVEPYMGTAGKQAKRRIDAVHRLNLACRPLGFEFFLLGDKRIRWRSISLEFTMRQRCDSPAISDAPIIPTDHLSFRRPHMGARVTCADGAPPPCASLRPSEDH